MHYGAASLDGPLGPAALPNVHALQVSSPSSPAVPLPYRNSAFSIHRDSRQTGRCPHNNSVQRRREAPSDATLCCAVPSSLR